MNQILDKKHIINEINVEFSNEIFEIPYNKTRPKSRIVNFMKINKYKIQFLFSTFFALLICFIILLNIIKTNRQERISRNLLSNYNLTTIYQKPISSSTQSQPEVPFVIGILKIDKLNISYPILSETNDDLLKISICRFTGPMPNNIGNLCIAGHNYIDNRFFSRLSELENKDIIEIYDLTGKSILYEVYNKYEVNANDFTCTHVTFANAKVITLITCSNMNSTKRIVVQAKEK